MTMGELDRTGADLAVHVVGLGARTPLGATALSTAAAVRAGISRQREHPSFVDSLGEPFNVASVPYLPTDLPLVDRLFELTLETLVDAMRPLGGVADWDALEIPLFMGLPGPGAGRPPNLALELVSRLPDRIGDLPAISRVDVIAAGHAAGLMALEKAWRLLCDGVLELCLVGGVESYLDADVIRGLDDRGRVLSERSPFGFCPGEGAGFVLLASSSEASRLRSLGRVISVATRREENLVGTDTVCTGEGLSAAWKAALEPLSHGVRVSRAICDLNGEPYRADEIGFALSRTAHRLEDPSGFLVPAECWGDMGAASGPLFVALALAEGLRGHAEGPLTLLSTSSDGGERCAALLEVERR